MKIKDEGKTAAECAVKAEEWLNRAIGEEQKGKSETWVNRVLDTAILWENAAHDGRA